MANFHEKLARFDALRSEAEAMQQSGIDLRSKQAAPLGLKFIHALVELAEEFGYKILKPMGRKDDFVRPDPTMLK